MNKKPLYAVVRGRRIGIFRDWDKVKSLVNRYPNSKHKKFSTFQEVNNYFKENTGLWLRVADIDKEFNDIEEAREFIFNRKEKEKIQKKLNEKEKTNNISDLCDKKYIKEKKGKIDDIEGITIISLDQVDKIGF